MTTTAMAPGSKEWLAVVSASKVAPILGISPHVDQFTMWHTMAGHLPPVDQTDAMRRGSFHEGAVIQEFFHQHPELQSIPDSHRTITADHWLVAQPDALALDETGHKVLVEAKTAASWEMWGEQGTDEVPEHYRAQVILCADIAGADRIMFAVMGPFWDYREYQVNTDPRLAAAIRNRCYDFWQSVQADEEPELSATVASYETWTKVREGEAEGTVEIPPELAIRYLSAMVGEKDVKPAKALLANYLDEHNAAAVTCQGQTVAIRQRGAHGMTIRIPRKTPDLTRIEITQ